jgi:hypothetical protein
MVCSLYRTTDEGVKNLRMERGDRGAKSCVREVVSSGVPRQRKDRGPSIRLDSCERENLNFFKEKYIPHRLLNISVVHVRNAVNVF